MVAIAIMITERTMPLAIISLFSFKRIPNNIKFTMEPKVISLPKDPCDFKTVMP